MDEPKPLKPLKVSAVSSAPIPSPPNPDPASATHKYTLYKNTPQERVVLAVQWDGNLRTLRPLKHVFPKREPLSDGSMHVFTDQGVKLVRLNDWVGKAFGVQNASLELFFREEFAEVAEAL